MHHAGHHLQSVRQSRPGPRDRTHKGQLPRTRSLRLIQPEKLLELLAENYAPPSINQRFTAKTTLTPDQFCRRLTEWRREAAVKVALTGSSSAGQYAVMAREPIQSFYCSNLEWLLNQLDPDLEETSRFPNIEFWRPMRTLFTSIRVIT